LEYQSVQVYQLDPVCLSVTVFLSDLACLSVTEYQSVTVFL
jgi:hypothetical protein